MPAASLLPIMIKGNPRLSVISAYQKTKRPFTQKPWYHAQLHTLLFREDILNPFQDPASSLGTKRQQWVSEQPASPPQPPCSSVLKASIPNPSQRLKSHHPKVLFLKDLSLVPSAHSDREMEMWSLWKMIEWRIWSSRKLKAEGRHIRTGNEAQVL